jgi:hypothetical protein
VSVEPFVTIIEAFEREGFGEFKTKTLKAILVIYELGSLRRSEIQQICDMTEKNVGACIDRLMGLGILQRRGKGYRCSPYDYKLAPEIRKIIEGTYEKRNDSHTA